MDDFPLAHGEHDPASAALKSPASHDVQDEASAGACFPAAQGAQDVDPVATAKWPGEQLVQIVAPLAANFPAGHFAQAPVSVVSPASQPPQALLLGLDSFPAGHAEHVVAPATANFPEAQAVVVLVPSHEDPAGHAAHEVRVVVVPPAVNEPTAHVAQVLTPVALYLESAPHFVCVLVPSHEDPAGHAAHEVRVVVVPPAVNEPTAHVAQVLTPVALYLESAPHFVCVLLPSHDEPAGQAAHAVRVVLVPPEV
jgi:hypothetical protein